jgi:hypothetical protein
MSNVRKHARSSSESGSGSHARRAPGTSTPFPITAIKFEYPEQEQVAGTGGDEPLPLPLPCRVPMGSPTPTRPAMSARERYEFAHNLQRALTSLKPKPFTLNLTIKTPPSLVGRTRRNGSQSVPSPSFSSSDTIVGLSFYFSKLFPDLII